MPFNSTDTIKARFLAFVHYASNGCWEWCGANDSRDYGKFWFQGRSQRAIRVALSLHRGRKVRNGYVVAHLCDNPRCVNPDHLREVRQRTNVRDMIRKGRAHWQNRAA